MTVKQYQQSGWYRPGYFSVFWKFRWRVTDKQQSKRLSVDKLIFKEFNAPWHLTGHANVGFFSRQFTDYSWAIMALLQPEWLMWWLLTLTAIHDIYVISYICSQTLFVLYFVHSWDTLKLKGATHVACDRATVECRAAVSLKKMWIRWSCDSTWSQELQESKPIPWFGLSFPHGTVQPAG